MAKNDSDDIRVFVVWSSQLGAEEKHLPEAMALMPDPRARHYWDPSDQVGTAYQNRLRDPAGDGEPFTMGSAAWDVWLLFGRDAHWDDDAPPDPAWWEHQLRGLPEAIRLDPERFAQKAAELLATVQ